MHAAVFVSSISKTTIQRIAPTAQSEKNRPSPSVCANGAMRKTAEERFNMLARGWLAYPVTSIHSHLPPKSGCICHPLLANNLYNRSSAVDSLIHNHPQVGKPTWGYDYTTVLRRLPHPSAAIINGLRKRRNAKKTAEERFHTLARGWLAYPVTPIHSHLPSKSGCRNVIPAKLPRDTYFLSIARKAEPEVAAAVARRVEATVRHTTAHRNEIVAATTAHTVGTR